MADNDDIKKYSKLLGSTDYDHEAAEQLADALNEIATLEARVTQLKQIVKENKELHQYVWRTANNEVIALQNLEDNHLENIMMHLLRNGQPIPRAIRGAAIKRGLTVPVKVSIDWNEAESRRIIEASTKDREDIW